MWVFAQRAVKELRELLSPREEPQGPALLPAALQTAAAQEVGHIEEPPEQASQGKEQVAQESEAAGAADDLFELLEQAESAATGVAGEELDLDSFWEEAAADAGSVGRGLSFEEAVRQGLLPPDLQS